MTDRVAGPFRRLAVYCGSSPGVNPAFADAARALGELLAERHLGLVYGGGHVGLMGVLADAVLAGGGEVTGVITRQLWDREVGHTDLTEMLVVDSMHERKLAMSDRVDAFVGLPGGMGTFEELFEVVTWTQLGIHDKPVGLLDVAGYYGPLLAFLDRSVEAGFVRREHRTILHADTDPAALLDAMARWQPTTVDKWLGPDAR